MSRIGHRVATDADQMRITVTKTIIFQYNTVLFF